MKQLKRLTIMASTVLLSATLFTGCTSGMDFFGWGGEKGNTNTPTAKIIDSDFTLTDTEGKTHTLSDYKGKKVYIKFWASWCSVCMKTLGETNALAGEDKDFIMLSVVAPGFGGEMTKDKFIPWFRGLHYENLPVLLDEGGEVTRKYGVRFYPTSVLIDSEGVVRTIQPGHIPKDRLKQMMNEMK